ncbi:MULTISPECIES: hypothetical protein, partial [unclassified Burkholderia]
LDETHREAVERIHAICGKRPSPVDGYFNGLLVVISGAIEPVSRLRGFSRLILAIHRLAKSNLASW